MRISHTLAIASILFLVFSGNALATCGYRSDGKYDCGTRTNCGYTSAGGKYDCGTRTNCGYKSAEGKYHCEGDG